MTGLWTSGAGRRSRSEQRAESFLGEVLVVGQHLRQPLGLHRVHGNAVCEAVALVETSFVEVETFAERGSALLNDTNGRGIEQVANRSGYSFAK